MMQPTYNPDNYTHERNQDNTVDRIYLWGERAPEMTQEYFDSRIQQEIENRDKNIAELTVQREKLAAFEAENPPYEIEEPEEPTDDPVVEQ